MSTRLDGIPGVTRRSNSANVRCGECLTNREIDHGAREAGSEAKTFKTDVADVGGRWNVVSDGWQ